MSAIYPKYKQAVISGGANHDLSAGNVKAILVDTADYTYSAAHEFLSDVPAGARVDITANLANKTFTNGVFDADDTSFAAADGDISEAIIIFIDTGVEGTSRLVAYIDTFSSGMPVDPNTGDINVTWDNGASKIFAL